MASSWHKWQPDAGSHFGNQAPVAKSEWPPIRCSHVGVNPQWQPSGNQIFETLFLPNLILAAFVSLVIIFLFIATDSRYIYVIL